MLPGPGYHGAGDSGEAGVGPPASFARLAPGGDGMTNRGNGAAGQARPRVASPAARVLLVLVQVVGGAAILAYPAVLAAGVMGIAGPGSGPRAFLGRLVLAASLAYPLVWVVLFWLSWRALRRGRTGLAFALSAPPFVATLAGLALLVASSRQSAAIVRGYETGRIREAERAGGENPLAGSLLLFERGVLSREQLHEAIRTAEAAELSRPVERRPVEVPGVRVQRAPGVPPAPVRYRTPLAIALEGSALARTLESRPDDGLAEAARLLLARGARLSDEEEAGEAKLVWLAGVVAKGTALPDRSAETENPLVWAIVSSRRPDDPAVAQAVYAAASREPGLLRKPTTTYGTPLRASLLRGMDERARDLIRNGAVLSEEEQRVPSLAGQLERFLALPVNEGLRGTYGAARLEPPERVPARLREAGMAASSRSRPSDIASPLRRPFGVEPGGARALP